MRLIGHLPEPGLTRPATHMAASLSSHCTPGGYGTEGPRMCSVKSPEYPGPHFNGDCGAQVSDKSDDNSPDRSPTAAKTDAQARCDLIDKQLKRLFGRLLDEEIPDRFLVLLETLRKRDAGE